MNIKQRTNLLVKSIGLETYEQISKKIGGKRIYINTYQRINTTERNKNMLYDFIHGISYDEISKKYNISLSHTYRIIRICRDKEIINDYIKGIPYFELLKKYEVKSKHLTKIIDNYTKEKNSERGVSNVQ